MENRDRFKVTYKNARKVDLTTTSIKQTLNIIKTLNDISNKDFVGLNNYTVEDLVEKLEEIAERMEHKIEFEVRV